jgi:hypothetical protein
MGPKKAKKEKKKKAEEAAPVEESGLLIDCLWLPLKL